MNTPINILFKITLVVDTPLDKSLVKAFYHCVNDVCPAGVLSIAHSTDDNGEFKGVSLVHRIINGKNYYMIPISRPLGAKESTKVADTLSQEFIDLDFDLEVSELPVSVMNNNTIDIENDSYMELCASWAKKQHDTWMKERQDDGWTYGTTINFENKTHPLLRTWDQLPEKFKKIDTDQPQMILDLLSNQGYSIVRKDELDKLINMVKNIF